MPFEWWEFVVLVHCLNISSCSLLPWVLYAWAVEFVVFVEFKLHLRFYWVGNVGLWCMGGCLLRAFVTEEVSKQCMSTHVGACVCCLMACHFGLLRLVYRTVFVVVVGYCIWSIAQWLLCLLAIAFGLSHSVCYCFCYSTVCRLVQAQYNEDNCCASSAS